MPGAHTRISVFEAALAADGDRSFRVEVTEGDVHTIHTVYLPDGLAEELGWSSDAAQRLIEVSFEYLLEREPPTSILRSFSLDVISRYFPDWPSVMRRMSG